jgi:hypothetical protein
VRAQLVQGRYIKANLREAAKLAGDDGGEHRGSVWKNAVQWPTLKHLWQSVYMFLPWEYPTSWNPDAMFDITWT